MSRSVKYIRWQRISRKYQMRWKDIQRFPQLYPTHNTSYLNRNRRVWLWAWRRKKTMENVEMVIKHISWAHAPGTPSRFYSVKAKGSRIHAWHHLIFANWQLFSKDVTMTGYWMRGYSKRAELIPYPYDHHGFDRFWETPDGREILTKLGRKYAADVDQRVLEMLINKEL